MKKLFEFTRGYYTAEYYEDVKILVSAESLEDAKNVAIDWDWNIHEFDSVNKGEQNKKAEALTNSISQLNSLDLLIGTGMSSLGMPSEYCRNIPGNTPIKKSTLKSIIREVMLMLKHKELCVSDECLDEFRTKISTMTENGVFKYVDSKSYMVRVRAIDISDAAQSAVVFSRELGED